MPKEGSQCMYLSVILIDSVFRTGKNYYSQVALEECKYNEKRQYGCKRYKYLSKDEKQRLVEYKKNCSRMQKIKTG